MAVKRMFSKKIIDSDAFLEMPLTTQALYFHLNMRADDDGFIGNPKTIQRLIRASEDDLKLLIVKGFLIPREHGVVVVKHWMIHNTIRKDRYSPTSFQDEGRGLCIKENGSYTLDENKAVARLETRWQKSGNPDSASALGLDSALDIEKILLPNKENKQQQLIVESTAREIQEKPKPPYSSSSGLYIEVQNLYNSICTSFRPVERLTTKRKGCIKVLLDKGYKLDDLKKLFERTMKSEYFSSLKDGQWKPSFDWLIQEENMTAVLEGKYDKVFSFQGKQEKKNKFNSFKGRNYSSEDMLKLEKELLES